MTQEFDRVRESFASSLAGRILSSVTQIIASAWHSSAFASAMRRITGEASGATVFIRAIAIAIAVAALLQPVLMQMTSRTVRPAMPLFVFVTIALAAAAAAWRPEVIAASWPQSRLARWLRR